MKSEYRCRCPHCAWMGTDKDLLKAINPFDVEKGDTVWGCPSCREPMTPVRLCDVDRCCFDAACGFMTPFGYRMTCAQHADEECREFDNPKA